MSAPDQPVEESRGVSWRLVVGAVLLAVVLVIVLQNTKRTTFQLFWTSVSAPLWILTVATLVLGFLIGWLAKGRRVKRRTNA